MPDTAMPVNICLLCVVTLPSVKVGWPRTCSGFWFMLCVWKLSWKPFFSEVCVRRHDLGVWAWCIFWTASIADSSTVTLRQTWVEAKRNFLYTSFLKRRSVSLSLRSWVLSEQTTLLSQQMFGKDLNRDGSFPHPNFVLCKCYAGDEKDLKYTRFVSVLLVIDVVSKIHGVKKVSL